MKKRYEDKAWIENKLNVYYALDQITDEEYTNLMLKAEEAYFVAEVIEETENSTEVTTDETEDTNEEG